MAAFRFPKAQQEKFLEHVRAGMQRGVAADRALGESASNRRRVRDYIASHPEFLAAVLDAEVEATEHVRDALYQAAISGSVAAAKTWLEISDQNASEEHPKRPGAPAPPISRDDPFSDLDELAARRKR